MSKKIGKRAFTIVELLIVIAILGLLSSIILVSTKGSKDSAELSKRKTFSHSLKNALGASLKSEYSFDNGLTTDGSGSGIDGFFNNMVVIDDGLEKKGVKPNTSGFYDFRFNVATTTLNMGKIGFTFEEWMYPYSISSSVSNFIFSSYTNSYEMYYNSGTLFFKIYQAGSGTCQLTFAQAFDTFFNVNNWNHIVGTYSNAGVAKVYINGKQLTPTTSSCVAGDVYYSPIPWPLSFIFFGGSTTEVNAKFDQVRLYNDVF